MTNIFIVDDHKIFREGLASLLKSTGQIKTVTEAKDGKEALSLLEKEKADIIILDLSLPDIDGLSLAKIIKERYSEAKIIILTMHKDINIVKKAFKIGALAYILKENAFDDLIYAIKKVREGNTFVSESLAENIFCKKPFDINDKLTARETEVLTLIATGLTNKEIAEKLFISVKTVETHRTRIMEKLNIHNTAELVRYAIKEDLVR